MAHCNLHEGWHLLLQHPIITQHQQLVCTLLCTSQSLRAAVHSAAAGQVLCRVANNRRATSEVFRVISPAHLAHSSPQLVTASTAASFKLWLKQHSRLLHTLDLGPRLDEANVEATLAACAQGLASASAAADAAGQPGLLVQGYRGPWEETILQQLPAATLTYLSITDAREHAEQMDNSYGSLRFEEVVQPKRKVFARFTKLRHLSLLDDDCNCTQSNVSGLLPALHGMTQLTFLEVGASRGVEEFMQHLPASLQVLRLGVESGGYCLEIGLSDDKAGDFRKRWPDPVDLSHLASLTKLDMCRQCPFMVQTGDILPPNVLELDAGWVLDWDALLRLKDLRKLSLTTTTLDDEDDLTVERVNMIRAQLTNLTSMEIIRGRCLTEELIRAYSQLPLHSLQDVPVMASAVPIVASHLSSLTSITGLKLRVEGPDGQPAGIWQHLAKGLTPLTQLLELDLWGPDLEDNIGGDSIAYKRTAAASVPIARAVAGMRGLRALKLFPIHLSTAAVLMLAEATALTRLELQMAELDDFGVNSLVVNLPALHVLDISENSAVTNAVMPVIGKHLQELKECRLEHTHVDLLGLGCLTSLRQLESITVCMQLVITPAHLAHSSAQLVTASTAASFQLWLQQHSRLLHTLDLGPGLEEEHAAATAAACAEGLALARQGLANAASAAADAAITAAEATGLPGLLLQGFRGPWEETILQQLPAATLTYLSITDPSQHAQEMEEAYGTPRFTKVARPKRKMFARFTALRHVSLLDNDNWVSAANVSGLLPALQGMTQLTFLEVGASRGVEQFMRHLPQSLQVLRLGVESHGYCLGRDETDDNDEGLDFNKRWPEPADFSHLTSLTKLDMCRECPFMVQNGDILPPNLLELETGWVLDWDAVLRLQELRKLSLRVSSDDDITAERIRSIKAQLTSLTSVAIIYGEPLTEELIRAYAKLPRHSMKHVQIKADAVPAVAPHLSLLMSLTKLQMRVEGVVEPMHPGWQADTWRHLARAGQNDAVTNAFMPVVGSHLRKLRDFQLEHTGVDALGLGCLTSLRQLQEVRVCKRLVAAAERVVALPSTVDFAVVEAYCDGC